MQTQITVMGTFLPSVSVGVSSFNFSHDFFFNFLVMMTWRGSVVSCHEGQNILQVAILFFLISSAISTEIGLAVLHYQSQHSFSLFLSIIKEKIFFSNFSFLSLIYHPSNFFLFLPKGSKFLWMLLDRHLQVQNRHLVAAFRSLSLI